MNLLKKPLMIAALLAATFLQVNAQEMETEEEAEPVPVKIEKRKMLEHQLGFNATNFIQSMVNLSNNPLPGSPYDFNYKCLYLLKPGYFHAVGLRTGVGYFQNEFQNEDPNNLFKTNIKITNFRIGAEVQKQLSERWTVYAGIDYVVTVGNSYTESSFDGGFGRVYSINEVKSKGEGAGPVFGVQFNLTKYMCLGTEISFYKVKSSNTNTLEQNGFKQAFYGKSTRFSTTLPAFINFNIRF